MKKSIQTISNQRGQTLIEYLIIVAILGVGSITLTKLVGQNINNRFAEVVRAMGGKVEGSTDKGTVKASHLNQKDMSNFANGTVSGKGSGFGNSSDD